ncbi:hypothetical protein TB2_018698 [Malus domestica]
MLQFSLDSALEHLEGTQLFYLEWDDSELDGYYLQIPGVECLESGMSLKREAGSDFGCAGSCSFCSEPRSTAGGDEKRHTDGYQGIVEGHGSTWEWSVWQYFTGCKAYVRVL